MVPIDASLLDHTTNSNLGSISFDNLPFSLPALREVESAEIEKEKDAEDEDRISDEKKKVLQDKEDNEVNGSEEATTFIPITLPFKESYEVEIDVEDTENKK